MSEKPIFLTGSDPIASRIANSLGLGDLNLNAISIHIQADEVISVECRFFPTQEQVKKAADEIATLEGKGVIIGETEFFYSSDLEDEE